MFGSFETSNARVNNMISREARLQKMISIFFRLTSEINEKGRRLYAHNLYSVGRLVPVMITLTFPDNTYIDDDNVNNYMKKIKRYALREWSLNLRYFWVAETTKKGVLHYHIVTWLPKNKKLPPPNQEYKLKYKQSTKTYPAMWKHWAEIDTVKKGVYTYLKKYLSKQAFTFCYELKGKRIYGYGGLDKIGNTAMHHSFLPLYVRKFFYDLVCGKQRVGRKDGGFVLQNINIDYKRGINEKWIDDVWIKSQYEIIPERVLGDDGRFYMCFYFGEQWSPIKDDFNDIWIPF